MTRGIGIQHPSDAGPLAPDQVTTRLMTGGSSAQAGDWETTAGAAANAADAGVHIVRVRGMTTGGGDFMFSVNLFSTAASVPASGTSISSSGVNHPIATGPEFFQVPGNSTGYSFAAFTSGYVIMEQWRK